ncbi:MAG TPA: ABC transporter permease, partial [Candidatus Dormibacteraeota bacterium]|nr:ABC transporter permease [Candidatus Dormibacteraeota bacterium]
QLAKIIVSLITILPLAFGGLAILNPLLDFQLDLEDYLRIMMVLFIHSGLFLICLALIETIIASAKLRLLGQSFFTFLLIIASGTLIPTIYFPLSLQEFLPYVFSNEGFHWLQEVILNERFYVDYVPLLLMGLTGLFILVGCSLWKERIKA